MNNSIAIAKALNFWNKVYSLYPHQRILNLMEEISEGKADYWRNQSLALVAISDNCRIGRFGFDDKKYNEGKKNVQKLAEESGIIFQA